MALNNGGVGGNQSGAPGAPQPYSGPTSSRGRGTQGARGPAGPQGPPNIDNGPGTASGDTARNSLSAYGAGPNPNQGFIDYVNSPLGKYMSSLGANNSQNYMGAFQNALGTARSDIGQQLAGALADIKQNQGYAQQALGQLPGQINQSYATANQMMNAGQHAASQHFAGLDAGTAANTGPSLSQYMAPTRAAIAGEQAGEQANVPLLGVGIQQAANQQAAAANNAALGDYSQLAMQQAQMSAQAQMAAQSQQAQATQQQQQNVFGLLQGAQNNQYTLGQIHAQSGGTGYGSTQQQQQLIQSPQYLQAVQAVQGGQYKSLADLQKAYPSNPLLWQLVGSQYGLK